MSEPSKKIIPLRPDAAPADRMIVTMNASELRQLVREEVKAALAEKNGTDTTDLLRVSEAAKRLNQSKDWLYRHWQEVGGKKLGPKSIRFAASDIEKFIAKRGS
jgi:predicted DNA-binding transcriptional regulator AlpA